MKGSYVALLVYLRYLVFAAAQKPTPPPAPPTAIGFLPTLPPTSEERPDVSDPQMALFWCRFFPSWCEPEPTSPPASLSPTVSPTTSPIASTASPTVNPTTTPTNIPTTGPTGLPTATLATLGPTAAPASLSPTVSPTTSPVRSTVSPEANPTTVPTTTLATLVSTAIPVAITSSPTMPNVTTLSPTVTMTSAPSTDAPMAGTTPPSLAPFTSVPVATTSSPTVPNATTSPPSLAPSTLVPVAATQVPATIGPTVQPAPTFPTLRINCGGAAYTDSQGRAWEADQFFVSGGVFAAPTTMTDAPLYGTEHNWNIWEHPTPPYAYEINVPDGEYGVVLHFAEVYFQVVNARVFDVWLEGSLLENSLDVYAEVGYSTPFIVYGTAVVSDGSLTIELVANIENPKISGIEVYDVLNYDGPTVSPTVSPAPTWAPTTLAPSISRAPTPYENIYINCGGTGYMANAGDKFWQEDVYFVGGGVYVDGTNPITPSQDDALFHSERYGTFTYEIPIPVGSYEVTVHLAELYFTGTGQRKFKLTIEDTVYNDVDIVQLGGGPYISTSLESAEIVSDGFLTISVEDSFPKVDQGKISAIEIKLLGPHLAHSVANGPYRAVDTDNTGSAEVVVDGGPSHTHGTRLVLTDWVWKEGSTTLGTGEVATLSLSVGTHTIALTVTDSGGNQSTEATTVTVLAFGHPAVISLSPSSGSIAGGDTVTISGSGFTYSAAETIVHFGLVPVTGNALTIIDEFTIQLTAPPTVVGAPVAVSVETPLDLSNSQSYNYIGGVPINFDTSLLFSIDSPTVAMFGPDRCLYVGTINGSLARVCLNADYTEVVDTVVSVVSQFRCILGIAFDPTDTKNIPDVYISTSFFFHGSPTSTSGDSINGDIRKVSGANLDEVEDVITGLPVSDHDHGINGLAFGANGELYFGIGSNTNGGKPGQLTGSQLQKENYYSAAINVAYMADPGFNGQITYDAPDDGSPNGGSGIEVFASGVRNPFGIVMHSNGKLYGTDNGPNLGYGDMTTGCGANDFVADQEEEDKILKFDKDNYYGHPNPKRAADLNEPRQCVWRSQLEPSDAEYTAPLLNVQSSTDGIIEYAYDHFDGQLRGNLIASVYQGPLLRVILDSSGDSVIPQSNPALLLVNADTSLPVGSDGLDVTQAPNGNLVECRISDSTVYVHKPSEPPTSQMSVKGVFPHWGSMLGGSILDVYGVNFSGNPIVQVGGSPCPVTLSTPTKIECTLPPGGGLVDVIVTIGASSSIFSKGYRYVSGQPGGPPTNTPTTAPISAIPTEAPVSATISPTTVAPTDQPTTGPTSATVLPTTVAPTSLAPVQGTLVPTTLVPTTLAPTTLAPTTLSPTSITITSQPSSAPTTMAPVKNTLPPTTLGPSVTPTTLGPTVSPSTTPTAGTPALLEAFDYAISTSAVNVNDPTAGAGEAVLSILPGEANVQTSNFSWRSNVLKNTGGKRIAAVFIDVSNAMFPDAVFDDDGSGGDDVAKQLSHDWGTTETLPTSISSYTWKWLPARSDPSFDPGAAFDASNVGLSNVNNLFVDALSDSGIGAGGGFRGELILFSDFDAGEEYEFSGDMDPNSLAGFTGGTASQGSGWDVGGISGAELINSVVTVLFGDGTTASGTIASDGSQAGAIARISDNLSGSPGLTVDGVAAPSSQTYSVNPSSVVISSTPGDTVRVSMVSAFDPMSNNDTILAGAITAKDLVTARLVAQYPTFPVTNAKSWQHFDVVIPSSGSLDVGNSFQYDNDFALGFTAVVIDSEGVPTSKTTDPIRLLRVA